MNEDHRDAINLYATKLLGAAAAEWRCVGCDPEGIDMQAGAATLRLAFPGRVTKKKRKTVRGPIPLCPKNPRSVPCEAPSPRADTAARCDALRTGPRGGKL